MVIIVYIQFCHHDTQRLGLLGMQAGDLQVLLCTDCVTEGGHPAAGSGELFLGKTDQQKWKKKKKRMKQDLF